MKKPAPSILDDPELSGEFQTPSPDSSGPIRRSRRADYERQTWFDRLCESEWFNVFIAILLGLVLVAAGVVYWYQSLNR